MNTVNADTLIADLMTAGQTLIDSLDWERRQTGTTYAGADFLKTALTAMQGAWRPKSTDGVDPGSTIARSTDLQHTRKLGKVRRINHADEFSDDSQVREKFFKATDPERTCLFYAELCKDEAYCGRFTALAAELIHSTAGATARQKTAYALISAYKQAELQKETRQNTEAEFWEFVSWQDPHWIDGQNDLRPHGKDHQIIPMRQAKPEVLEVPAVFEKEPTETQLELERERDTPKGGR